MILYVVTYDTGKSPTFKRRTGSYELDMDRMTKANIAQDILNGQFDDVSRVLECDPDDNTCQDITEEIAKRIVGSLNDDGEPCPDFLRDWIDEHSFAGAAEWLDRHCSQRVADRRVDLRRMMGAA